MPGPRVTQWDLGEVQPLSLCGGRVYGSRRPRSAPCRLLLKSLQTLPTPPPAAATTRKNEELVAGSVGREG